MTQPEWTQEERERAKAILQGDARTVRNRDTKIKDRIVTPETCHRWRDELAGSLQNADSIDTEYGVATVAKHASGRCHHDPHDAGIPLRRPADGGRWQRARMVTVNSRSGVYHTRVCCAFPGEVRVLSGSEARKQWRECRECSGRVPEAGPVPEASGDD